MKTRNLSMDQVEKLIKDLSNQYLPQWIADDANFATTGIPPIRRDSRGFRFEPSFLHLLHNMDGMRREFAKANNKKARPESILLSLNSFLHTYDKIPEKIVKKTFNKIVSRANTILAKAEWTCLSKLGAPLRQAV